MIQPLNQSQAVPYTGNRTGEISGPAAGLTGPIGAQVLRTGLGPERIVPGASKAQENGTKAVGKDGQRDTDSYECQTCKNRKYKDGSDDPGVSFKTATALSPEKAAVAVRSHEMEHVSREQARAKREGREVVSQTVTYNTGVCPECGKSYVSGGSTKTVTKGQIDRTYGMSNTVEKGRYLDQTA